MWLENCNALKGEPKEQDTWVGTRENEKRTYHSQSSIGEFFHLCPLKDKMSPTAPNVFVRGRR